MFISAGVKVQLFAVGVMIISLSGEADIVNVLESTPGRRVGKPSIGNSTFPISQCSPVYPVPLQSQK